MKQRTADMMKIVKVIKSCTNEYHINATKKMIENFFETYKTPGLKKADFEAGHIYHELCDELYKQRDKIKG